MCVSFPFSLLFFATRSFIHSFLRSFVYSFDILIVCNCQYTTTLSWKLLPFGCLSVCGSVSICSFCLFHSFQTTFNKVINIYEKLYCFLVFFTNERFYKTKQCTYQSKRVKGRPRADKSLAWETGAWKEKQATENIKKKNKKDKLKKAIIMS